MSSSRCSWSGRSDANDRNRISNLSLTGQRRSRSGFVSAILWDGMANTWVYLEAEKNLFRRQRVQMGPACDDLIVIERGLVEGQSVVTVGAESLYGEEFKSQIEVLEDDD